MAPKFIKRSDHHDSDSSDSENEKNATADEITQKMVFINFYLKNSTIQICKFQQKKSFI